MPALSFGYSNLMDGTNWISTPYFLYKRRGKTVYVKRNTHPSVNSNIIFSLGTLPEEYRPKSPFLYVCYGFENSGWVYRRFTVEITGEITVITSSTTDYMAPFFFSFPINV